MSWSTDLQAGPVESLASDLVEVCSSHDAWTVCQDCLSGRFNWWCEKFSKEGFGRAFAAGSSVKILHGARHSGVSTREAIQRLDRDFEEWLGHLRGRDEARREARPQAAAAASSSTVAATRPQAPAATGFTIGGGVDAAAYLAALDALPVDNTPLGPPRITHATGALAAKPQDVFDSKSVNGHNNDCVIAAFRSARGGALAERSLDGVMTSTDDGIAKVAALYGMRRCTGDELVKSLKAGGRRGVITATSLDGMGYHAYTALGFDATRGKIVAWDPDNTQRDVKLVPPTSVHLAYLPA